MLAFGIRYLNGFSAAAEPDNLESAEWPPHPARVYMALAAAHFQTGADPKEREVLLWMERSGSSGRIKAPAIAAPTVSRRAVVDHFVPVNDRAVWEKKSNQTPPPPLQSVAGIMRERQPRGFTRAWLDEDTVYLIWSDLDLSDEHRASLRGLCAKVNRIGHSTSLVQMWLADEEEIGKPNWVPDDERATVRLRVPGPGTLEYLERLYNASAVEAYAMLKVHEMQAEDPKERRKWSKQLKAYSRQPPARQRPSLSRYQGYAEAVREPETAGLAETVFSPHPLMLQIRPETGPCRQLDLVATLVLTKRWREAILCHASNLSEPVRRMLSGHDASGAPATDPHLAFIPLAFVGHEHADGHLLGMGLVLPRRLSGEERHEALGAVASVRVLKLGRLGLWQVEPVRTVSQPPLTLRADVWTAWPHGATHWSTVTPIVFDRHPKDKDKARYLHECALMIRDACNRIGLPSPRDVIVTQVSAHPGVPPSFEFPRLKRKDGTECRHSHAILVFDEPVGGPVMIGAGRFRGYGVCRPIEGG